MAKAAMQEGLRTLDGTDWATLFGGLTWEILNVAVKKPETQEALRRFLESEGWTCRPPPPVADTAKRKGGK
jgi:hypothetical protein